MTGATLDHLYIGVRDEFQHFARLRTHVLRSRMTGNMQGDAAIGDRLHSRGKTFVAGDIDDIFAKIEGGFRQLLDVGIAGQDQRPFEFQH